MSKIFTSSNTFVGKKSKSHLCIEVVHASDFQKWQKQQTAPLKNKSKNLGFEGKNGQIIIERDKNGNASKVIAGIEDANSIYAFAALCTSLEKKFPSTVLKSLSFELSGKSLKDKHLEKACIGWGIACYKFDNYTSDKTSIFPKLLLPKGIIKKSVLAHVDAVNQLRNMINTPANDCGPDELEKFAKFIAEKNDVKIKVIKDKQLLTKNFPLIYTVGKASPRAPRLIEFTWGKASDPKITLIGKGVVFDTGGLNLKPGQYMRHMKKDMGGAAHALNLAYMIMEEKLPVRLRVLIPAVENSVAGEAFRPGDVLPSRKGLFVENTNTDAEGRLILADSITYACEDDPELIIDYATLTGSARAALGPDIPAFFSTDEKLANKLQKLSFDQEDPVWNMPLHHPYKKHFKSSTGDIVNSASIPGDLIYSALFLECFLTEGKKKTKPHWVHFDCYAWEQTGRPGRPSGAADTGMRAMFKYLKDTYSKKTKKKA